MPSDQVTRCPHCLAVFRVTPEALALASGWLRCGQCREPFDSTGLTVAWSPEPEAITQRLDLQVFLKEQDRGTSPALPPVAPISDELLSFEQALASFPGKPAETSEPQHIPLDDLPAASEEKESTPSPAVSRTLLVWGLGLVLLALVQLAWASRSTWWQTPWIAATAQAWCDRLGCQIPDGRDPDLLRIDGSRLVRTEQGYRLEWTLRSLSHWPLRMAAMEVVLKDEGGHALMRRVFTPTEMAAPVRLEPGQSWDGMLALQISGELETPVTGYHLLVFYP